MSEPRQPPRPPAQGFAGLADLFPDVQGSAKPAKSIEQHVDPPLRLPAAQSSFVAPTAYIAPSTFQVPTAFASALEPGVSLSAPEPALAAMPVPTSAAPDWAGLQPKQSVPPPSSYAVAMDAPVALPLPSFGRVEPTWQDGRAQPSALVTMTGPATVLTAEAQAGRPDAPDVCAAPEMPSALPLPLAAPGASLSGPPALLPSHGATRAHTPRSSGLSVWIGLAAGAVLVITLAVGLVQWFSRYERPIGQPQPPPPVAATPVEPIAAPAVEPPVSLLVPSPPLRREPPADVAPQPPQELAAAAPVPLAAPSHESRPAVGGEGRSLDGGQVRYCVAQNMRLNTQSKLVRADAAKEVNRYSDLLNDYNARCRNFKYEHSELQRIVAIVESDRGQIEAQAKSDWLARRDDVLEDVSPVNPLPAPASLSALTPATPAINAPTPRPPRRIEPEPPLWWCLPGPENKCVPM